MNLRKLCSDQAERPNFTSKENMNFYRPEIIDLLNKDKKLKKIISQVPPETLKLKDADGMVREHLISSIVSQQLAVKAARVILGRFLDLYPRGFPSNKSILNTELETLRSVGLSNQKANYIKNIAAHFSENRWKNESFHSMDDETIIDTLTQIKGVGRWTAEMVLIFCLGRPDVFAVDDLGLQTPMIRLYQIEGSKKEQLAAMKLKAEKWKPYRTAASLYLWAAKDLKIEI